MRELDRIDTTLGWGPLRPWEETFYANPACARFIHETLLRKGDLSKMASVGAPSVADRVPKGMPVVHPALRPPICDMRLGL